MSIVMLYSVIIMNFIIMILLLKRPHGK